MSHVARRDVLRGLAVGAMAVLSGQHAFARETRIASLIAQAQAHPELSARIALISRGLLGRPYRANTLIGSPRRQEVLVLRDDGFDCVTYCETVLAAADARDLAGFEENLRAIRYRAGRVVWHERNHDFAAWCARNVENGFCRPLAVGTSVPINKTLTWPRALGRRHYLIAAIPRAALLANAGALMTGDIVGFVSMRPSLDYYHTGFVTFGAGGELLLRHASQHHRRVLDERMERFMAANRVRYVTLLRPLPRA
jgi:hypothetical protein